MRILFSSTYGHGHIYPMVPLAFACVAAGHEVRWATSGDACPLVAAAGLEAVPAGMTGQVLCDTVDLLKAHAATLAPPSRAAFMFPHMFGAAFAPAMLPDLLAVAGDWKADLLVHENGELASPLVGALLGVPSVTHAFGGAIPAAFIADAGERLAPLWAEHGLPLPAYAGCFTSLYLDICPPEVQTVSTRHIDAVQAMRPVAWAGAEKGELPACLREDGPPLVYLTLGTVQNHAPVLAAAVEALAQLPVRVLVTVGPDGHPEALGEQPSHVTVERFVPQTEVLPRCAAVVSHAGSGTFLGTLAEGLPQLCLPQAADQFRNAEGGVQSGAALALRPDEATPLAIADAVRRLLDDPSYRTAAQSLAEQIRGMPAPEQVVPVLERLHP